MARRHWYFNSIVDPKLTEMLMPTATASSWTCLGVSWGHGERRWVSSPNRRVGKAHGRNQPADAMKIAWRRPITRLTHDDGISLIYDNADLILVGVSRSGKTPTCLYMALAFWGQIRPTTP